MINMFESCDTSVYIIINLGLFLTFVGAANDSNIQSTGTSLGASTPQCGIKPEYSQNTANVPWHATIYQMTPGHRKKQFLCGATIITDKLLITAAHCVFDETTDRAHNADRFFIATGNYNENYDFEYPPSVNVTRASVKNIYITCEYRGQTANYEKDIAFLHIDPPLVFTSHLLPICIGTPQIYSATGVGERGVFPAFRRNGSGGYDSILQPVRVATVERQRCIERSEARNFITEDKFCVVPVVGSSVCKGDSGSGLAIVRDNVSYIHGVSSLTTGTGIARNSQSCQENGFSLYTSIGHHITWMNEIILRVNQGRPIDQCIQPSKTEKIWCKALHTNTMAADCNLYGLWTSCASPVLPGTQAVLSCSGNYRQDFVGQRRVTCNSQGQWEPEPIKCIPVCGTTHKKQLEVDGQKQVVTDSPWHAAVYEKSDDRTEKKFICGATVITENLVITAAHCVFNEYTKQPNNPGKYLVTIGAPFQDYDFVYPPAMMVRKAQVKNIYINCNYKGMAGNYGQDIAILHFAPSFAFQSYLAPICLDININDHTNDPGNYSEVSGAAFGKNPSGSVGPILRAFSLPVIPKEICIRDSLLFDARNYVTSDKLCAGGQNGSATCSGASGVGLASSKNDVWYLRGIQSVGIGRLPPKTTEDCSTYTIMMYTDVSFHIVWIQEIMQQVEEGMMIPNCSAPQNLGKSSSTTPRVQPALPSPSQPTLISSACPRPPEIQNGFWKLHSSQCPNDNDHCDPPAGMKMVPGTYLVYFCDDGYELSDVGGVHCAVGGRWSDVPRCREIRCRALDTSSTKAVCSLNGEWTSCANPVLPRTQAEVSCRTSYRQEDSFWQRNRVRCNSQGQWEPEPIRCIPVCGTKPPIYIEPRIVNGQTPVITDFPWHATIYRRSNNSTEKKFICGATIITENLLITAAHCVFDEGIKKPENPRKFVIATGNLFRDYDYEYPPPIVVRKAQVKNIYMNCDYQGLDGNYDRDIAILHIEPSINFTSYLAPICLDTNIRSLAIDLGTNGVVAGFGRTAEGSFSSILQSLSVPVVPKNVCIRESNEVNARRFVTADKFCAGYRNGSSACDGDSGGGLTFETNNLWYIRGIVSSGLGMITTGGTRTCDNTRYTIYTEISFHMSWIQDVMLKIEEGQSIPKCSTLSRRRRSDSN